MLQSLAQLYVHPVFSTKHRVRSLQGLEARAHAFLIGPCKNLDSPSLIVGGVDDHVYLLLRPSKNIALNDLVGELKRESLRRAGPAQTHSVTFTPTDATNINPVTMTVQINVIAPSIDFGDAPTPYPVT